MRRTPERGSPEYWKTRERHWQRHRNPMTVDQYLELHREQQGKCGVCRKPEKKLYELQSDHHHSKTAPRSRGLLCSYCNRWILSNSFDTALYVRGVVEYLFRWESEALTGLSLCREG